MKLSAHPDGIVLMDHGSRLPSSHVQLEKMAESLAAAYVEQGRSPVVSIAHLEVSGPYLMDAVEQCVRGGARRIVVVPCFLSRGRHVTEDIPQRLKEVTELYPEIETVIADPLSELPGFVQLLQSAVSSVLPEPNRT